MKRNILEKYNDVLASPELQAFWGQGDHRIESVFQEGNAQEFLRRIMEKLHKDELLCMLHDYDLEINTRDANHTISALLLGILAKKKLQVDMGGLPRVYPNSEYKNFLYFWIIAYIYHDAAKQIEQDSNYLEKIHDIDSLYTTFGVQYKLTEQGGVSPLIVPYFDYHRNHAKDHRGIDHGIASAVLMYDLLMKGYEEARRCEGKKHGVSFTHSRYGIVRRYSKDFPQHIKYIANVIAQHNMWRAKKSDQDEIDRYKAYGLDGLIPNDDGTHKIYLDADSNNKKDEFLFLLALVDSVEPVKAVFDQKEKFDIEKLKDINITFSRQNQKGLTIYCPNSYSSYHDRVQGMRDYIGVIVPAKDDSGKIKLTFESGKAEH